MLLAIMPACRVGISLLMNNFGRIHVLLPLSFILDEDESVTTLDPPLLSKSRQSIAEQGDEVMPLWDSTYPSQNQRRKGKFSQQTSDADSAIGMVCVCVCVCMCVHMNFYYEMFCTHCVVF